jgi:hypothetical protein
VIFTGVVLLGTSLPAVLHRSAAKQKRSPAFVSLADSFGALASLGPVDQRASTISNYDAEPQDTGAGQVLTVMTGPRQTLKELSLRYVGRFDDELLKEIRTLNPKLKDPDHLEAGQLIQIPLPPGALKKAKDAAQQQGGSEPQPSKHLFTKITAPQR